jgi:prevent-host-death family protein
MRKDRGSDPIIMNGQLIYNATTARMRLGDIIEDAHKKGIVSVIVSSRGRKVAVVPYKLLGCLNVGNFVNTGEASNADTMAEDVPRNTLGGNAHSPSPREVLQSAFGRLGPYKEPSE